MAQQLQPITIAAPGFYGINTQDSPVDQPPRFASSALNCIIDQYGRVGARKGYQYVTTTSTGLSSAGITSIYEYVTKANGTKVVISTGNNKVWTGTTTLTDATPASYTITANNWKPVELNEHVYFFQRGHEPFAYDETTGTVVKMSAVGHAAGTPPQANEALAAFGKVWVADFAADKHTVYWSDTLLGAKWTGGATGSIDLDTVWPAGNDEIVALAQHNSFLVIFGRRSVIIYQGADDPSTMALYDAIEGVGCIARDSVQNTGTDVLFLSENGVMSLGRVIQEKSSPMRDISKNVRNALIESVINETGNIRSVYSAEESFYLLSLPSNGIVYCFDMRGMLEDGSHRVTTWNNINPLCFRVNRDGNIYMGHPNGITLYSGYSDNAQPYDMEYFSNPLSFGNPTGLKIIKKLAFTLIGGSGETVNIRWSYDYGFSFKSRQFTLASGIVSEYNIAEFNVGQYSTGIILARKSIEASGAGFVSTVGVTAQINGSALSIQQIDVLALLGRLI